MCVQTLTHLSLTPQKGQRVDLPPALEALSALQVDDSSLRLDANDAADYLRDQTAALVADRKRGG